MSKKIKTTTKLPAAKNAKLLKDLCLLIDESRQRIAYQCNAELVLLYWNIGERILNDVLFKQRAEYGKQVIETLSSQLTVEYGRGFSLSNLWDMVKFAEIFADKKILQTLSGELGWSHFRLLISLDEPVKRDFYAEMCRMERWSVRTLQNKIGGMLFERTALSKLPAKLAEQELAAMRESDQLSPDLVFRDPYLLDFLGLRDTYSEKDLELAILREMESFLLELGSDFSFIARQKRITVDGEDFYLDLLFYHRGLRRLVVIELKLDTFSPSDKGQMELYLRWLDKYERKEGEETPIGLILCAGKSRERVELLALDKGDIRVASYITETLPKDVLSARLNEALKHARERLRSDLAE